MIINPPTGNSALAKTVEALVAGNQRATSIHNANIAGEIRLIGKKARKAARAVRARDLQRRSFEARP